MRALVTGGTGYIGSHLVQRLVAENHNVHILVRPSSKPDALETLGAAISLHLTDGSFDSLTEAVQSISPDIVFHTASLFLAEHQPQDVAPLIQSNILFPCQLIEAMARNKVRRLINCSTSWQHYQGADYNPVCLYAATKRAFVDLLRYYVEAMEINVIDLTLSDTYGPNDKRPKLFSALYRAAAAGQEIKFTPGNQLIDIVYIDDVVEAFVAASARLLATCEPRIDHYAVRADQPLRLRELVEIFSSITGVSPKIEWGGRPYRSREMMTPWQDGSRRAGLARAH